MEKKKKKTVTKVARQKGSGYTWEITRSSACLSDGQSREVPQIGAGRVCYFQTGGQRRWTGFCSWRNDHLRSLHPPSRARTSKVPTQRKEASIQSRQHKHSQAPLHSTPRISINVLFFFFFFLKYHHYSSLLVKKQRLRKKK